MARTIVGVNDPKAVQRYATAIHVDTRRESYWSSSFMSDKPSAPLPVQMLTHLENEKGDKINYNLRLQLKMRPVFGDDVLAGQEESLAYYTDSVYIDQVRGGVNGGGKMTQKRTLENLRDESRAGQVTWWSALLDEMHFMYASGARGANTDFIMPPNFTGFAGNAFTAPDSQHIMYGGVATSKATVATTDKMSLSVIDKAVTKATMMGGGTQGTPQIQPVMVEGVKAYVAVMNPFQLYDLRTSSGTGGWLDIQKALATNLGKGSPIVKGGLGMHNGVVLHSHAGVIRFDDYGAGTNVDAARALFLGRQALTCAYGSSGGDSRFDWHEETEDRGNQLVISTSAILGIKKAAFNGVDFGVIAIDTAAADPNA